MYVNIKHTSGTVSLSFAEVAVDTDHVTNACDISSQEGITSHIQDETSELLVLISDALCKGEFV